MTPDSKAEILLVIPEVSMGRELNTYLTDRDYSIEWVDDAEKAYNGLESRPFDVLVTELQAPRIDGLRLMGVAKQRNPDICVIMLADDTDVERAIEAMRLGAYDFQTKPLNMAKLEAVIQRGLVYQQLIYDQLQLKRRLDEQFGLGNLIGKSRPIVQAYNTVRQVAPSKLPVIIVGEVGAGKDLVAQVIHNSSDRRDGPFVKLNCSASAKTVLASELLGGGQRPATGPGSRGRIELADQGSLYLDETGGLPEELQTVILELLERDQFRRPEDDRPVNVDTRLIVSVRPASQSRKQTQIFLEELRRGFNAALVELPPLRNRKEDIPLLVDHFISASSRAHEKSINGISRQALDVLTRYDWPGNVGELRNVLEGAILAARGGRPLDVADIPSHLRRQSAEEPGEIRAPIGATMAEIERTAIEETLKACDYNKEEAAKTLGIGLRTLYRKLKNYEQAS